MHTICSTGYRLPTIVHTSIVPRSNQGVLIAGWGHGREKVGISAAAIRAGAKGVRRHNLAAEGRLTRQHAAVAGGAVDGLYSKVMGGLGRARDEEQPPSEDSIHPGDGGQPSAREGRREAIGRLVWRRPSA